MTTQSPSVALVLFVLLLCVNGQTIHQDSSRAAAPKVSFGELEQAAEDIISLTIAEVNNAKDFINRIPKLRGLSNEKGSQGDDKQLLQCVGGLTACMNDAVSKLAELEQLDSSSLGRDSKFLQIAVNGIVSFDDLCLNALKDVDAIINIMIQRKIGDIILLTQDVLYRVSKFEDEYGKTAGKP